jgi:putative transposase
MTLRTHGIPTTRAARWAALDRSTVYYRPHQSGSRKHADEPRVLEQLRQIAFAHPTFGHRRVWAMLRRAGLSVNRKRVHRLMAAEGLLRPAHFPRPRLPPTGRLSAERPNERWYTDLCGFRRLEMLGGEPPSISGAHIVTVASLAPPQ